MPIEPPPPYFAELDTQTLERLRALDPGGGGRLLERVLGLFRVSLHRLPLQMNQSRQAGDTQAVQLLAHTLKSSSASVGALRLSQLCAEVEQALHQGSDLAAIDAKLDDLVAESQRLCAVLPTPAERL